MSLPHDLVVFVKDEVARGIYGNHSDVVREGLRLLREREQKQSMLRRLLAKGKADVAAGHTQPLTDDLLRDVANRALAQAEHARAHDRLG